MPQGQESQREVLPIPNRPYTGLTTYDAKDPDTSFSPIVPCEKRGGLASFSLHRGNTLPTTRWSGGLEEAADHTPLLGPSMLPPTWPPGVE